MMLFILQDCEIASALRRDGAQSGFTVCVCVCVLINLLDAKWTSY